MKREYSKDYFITKLKTLDTRIAKLPNEQIDYIIDDGFAEICTVGMFFNNEEVISMKPYYDAGETKIELQVVEDVTSMYDYYLTVENQDSSIYRHGIKRLQESNYSALDNSDTNSMYTDSRYQGKVHIDLSEVPNNEIVDNAVLKYFYTPNSESTSYYMDQQTRLATESAMATAAYSYLHDVEKASQKRAAMTRQALAIIPINPLDLHTKRTSMFPEGV
jgi:hypothetical protein